MTYVREGQGCAIPNADREEYLTILKQNQGASKVNSSRKKFLLSRIAVLKKSKAASS
jgi:hypothetical protein